MRSSAWWGRSSFLRPVFSRARVMIHDNPGCQARSRGSAQCSRWQAFLSDDELAHTVAESSPPRPICLPVSPNRAQDVGVARLGNALLGLAVLCYAYAVLWQLGLVPGSRVTLHEPIALQRAGSTPGPTTGLLEAVPAEAPAVIPNAAPPLADEVDRQS